jgi:protein gp37
MTGAYWDQVLNLVTGCDPVSSGCDYCFAPPTAWIRKSNPNEAVAAAYEGVARRRNDKTEWTGRVNELPGRLQIPFRRRKPTTYYLTLNGDMFHKGVSDNFLVKTFAMVAANPHHTFLCTTKRHARMRAITNDVGFRDAVALAVLDMPKPRPGGMEWPLPNLRLAVSVENQATAKLRIPALLATNAAVRWISAEPLLGPITLWDSATCDHHRFTCIEVGCWRALDWVVTGGESNSPRAVHPDWVRSLRDQCVTAGVPFFFKQWGDFRPAEVFDAPAYATGRAYKNPKGGTSAASIRERGPSRTFRSGVTRAMAPGDRTAGGVLMLDRDTVAVKMGAKAAGRELDGRTWDELPELAGVR